MKVKQCLEENWKARVQNTIVHADTTLNSVLQYIKKDREIRKEIDTARKHIQKAASLYGKYVESD